jgi:hypothetical protein
MKINVAIIGKFVRKTTVSPMAITEQYNFGSIVKRQDLGIFVSSGQSG